MLTLRAGEIVKSLKHLLIFQRTWVLFTAPLIVQKCLKSWIWFLLLTSTGTRRRCIAHIYSQVKYMFLWFFLLSYGNPCPLYNWLNWTIAIFTRKAPEWVIMVICHWFSKVVNKWKKLYLGISYMMCILLTMLLSCVLVFLNCKLCMIHLGCRDEYMTLLERT